MIGKKNIIFGFFFLLLTAALGPYMVNLFGPVGEAQGAKQAVLGKLQLAVDADFEDSETLEPMDAEAIAKQNALGLLALNKALNARAPIDEIKGGPHAHGNLESLLNIAVGLVLCFTALAPLFKQIISWVFILGTLLHSGLLYLLVFDVGWAGTLRGPGVRPILILLGLLLAGIAVVMGLRAEPVKDS